MQCLTMRRIILSAILCALIGSAASAQGPQATYDPHALVRSWYLQYLDRDYDSLGMAYWTRELARGTSPQAALAKLLSSPEYYKRVGETPEEFVRALFLDITGREPADEVLQEWIARARAEDRQDVAYAILEQYPQSWQLPADPATREYLANIHANVRGLAFEVERLQEDIVDSLRGKKERTLYAQADTVLDRLRQLRRSAKIDVPRENLYADFDALDAELHKLMAAILALKDQRALHRVVARIEQADEGLHYAISEGDTSDERSQQVVLRQTRALIAEARQLEQTVRYALADDEMADALYESIGRYAQAVEHFQSSINAGFDRDHLAHDFATVNEAWLSLSEQIDAISPRDGHPYLRVRAQKLDAIHGRLDRLLGLETERPRVVIRYGRPVRRTR